MIYCYMNYKQENYEELCFRLCNTWYDLLNHLIHDHKVTSEKAFKAINRRKGVDRRIDGSSKNNRRKNYTFLLTSGGDNGF